MTWSGFSKIFLGLMLAIAIAAMGGLVTARILIARLAAPPPKPIYPNERSAVPKPIATSVVESEATKPVPVKPATIASPRSLPSGAYEGRVNQPVGLIVRDAPGREGLQVGGIEYNQQVVVLETSSDGDWQRIRLPNDREGWVKSGNIDRSSQQ